MTWKRKLLLVVYWFNGTKDTGFEKIFAAGSQAMTAGLQQFRRSG
jgi:hypothetical protein